MGNLSSRSSQVNAGWSGVEPCEDIERPYLVIPFLEASALIR